MRKNADNQQYQNELQNYQKCSYCDMKVPKTSIETHTKYCTNRPIATQQRQKCPFCSVLVMRQDFVDHMDNCGNRPDEYDNNQENYEESKEDNYLSCPLCQIQVPKQSLSLHLEDCFKKTQKKKCTSCSKMIEQSQYSGHLERCQKRSEYKQIVTQHRQEKEKDLLTESMLMDPTIAFLPCIYCQKDIIESRYEQHLLTCEQDERCDICKHSYPRQVFQDHRKMCELQLVMQMQEACVECQKCHRLVFAGHFEQHQVMHFQEEGGFDLNNLEQGNYPELDEKTKEKVNGILDDPRNKEINNMTEDQLYKYYHEKDLNEFQKKSGVSKQELKQNLNETFYNPDKIQNDEDKTCLICQDDFQKSERIRKLPCTHQFHQNCIDEWLSRNAVCPVCRKDIKEQIQTTQVEKKVIQQQQQKQYPGNIYNKPSYNSSNKNISNNNNYSNNISYQPPTRNVMVNKVNTYNNNNKPNNNNTQYKQNQNQNKITSQSPSQQTNQFRISPKKSTTNQYSNNNNYINNNNYQHQQQQQQQSKSPLPPLNHQNINNNIMRNNNNNTTNYNYNANIKKSNPTSSNNLLQQQQGGRSTISQQGRNSLNMPGGTSSTISSVNGGNKSYGSNGTKRTIIKAQTYKKN